MTPETEKFLQNRALVEIKRESYLQSLESLKTAIDFEQKLRSFYNQVKQTSSFSCQIPLENSLKTALCDIRREIKMKVLDNVFYRRYLSKFVGMNCMTIEDAAYLLTTFKMFNSVYNVNSLFSYCGISNSNASRYNKAMKTFLFEALSPRLKTHSMYRIYYWVKYYQLLNNNEESLELDHIQRRANRYMIQRFLRDYYLAFYDVFQIERSQSGYDMASQQEVSTDVEYEGLSNEPIRMQFSGEDYFDYHYILDFNEREVKYFALRFIREAEKLIKLFWRI